MEFGVRPPAVAGRFYPRDAAALKAQVFSYLLEGKKSPVIGCVIPHAGYMYSGHVAGAVFSAIEIPRRCIILCPNHTGRGQPLALCRRGRWATPLGEADIDEELAASLVRLFPPLAEDAEAHRSEHAIEVELPFLQMLRPDFQFVPIALGAGQFEVFAALGEAIARMIREQAEPILLIASSDMNHYENDAVTRVKDAQAIAPILALDPRGLYEVIQREQISMCGFGPVVTMLTAANQLGAKSANLVRYATSGDVSGDRDTVVGYAGITVA